MNMIAIPKWGKFLLALAFGVALILATGAQNPAYPDGGGHVDTLGRGGDDSAGFPAMLPPVTSSTIAEGERNTPQPSDGPQPLGTLIEVALWGLVLHL